MHENLMLFDNLNELLITQQLKQQKQARILVASCVLPVEIEIFMNFKIVKSSAINIWQV